MIILYAQIIAAVISAYSQYRTNKQQKTLANTAVQRRANDLRAAGFNPVLAAGGQGATTPELKSPAKDLPAFSAQSISKRLVVAQTEKLSAETEETKAKTAVIGAQQPLREAELFKAQFMGKLFQRLDSLGMNLEDILHQEGWADFFIKLFRTATSGKTVGTVGDLKSVGQGLMNKLPFKKKANVNTKQIYEKGETIPPNTKGHWEKTADGIKTGRYIVSRRSR